MNKSIKIILWLLFAVIAISSAAIYNSLSLKTPSDGLNGACKMIFSADCQGYLNNITKEGKFDEAISIQTARIKENEKLLAEANKNIVNKKWLTMKSGEIEKEYQAQSKSLKEKENGVQKLDKSGAPVFEQFEKDYSQIKNNEMTLRDISFDLMIIAAIQEKELKNKPAAFETYQKGEELLISTPYFSGQEDFLKMFRRHLKKLGSPK